MTESPSPAAPESASAPPGLLAFTPVPLARSRHDGWSVQRQRRFIVALHGSGTVGPAAARVGMTARSAYRLRARPGADSFAAAWDRALDEARWRALETVMDCYSSPEARPRFYRGRFTGTATRRSDERLLLAALRASAVANARARAKE